MKRRTSIYILIDPRNNSIRYIGKTVQKLEYRLKQHLSEKSNHKRATWIKSLKRENLVPVIKEIDYCDYTDSNNLEISWIEKYRFIGENLTNMTNGGDGTLGVTPTKEQRLARSIYLKKKFSEGVITPPMLGKTHTQETKDKISRIHKNKIVSEEFREKRRQIMLGTKMSKNLFEKLQKIHKKPIVRLDSNFKLVKQYDYLKQSKEDGFSESKVIDCCKGRKEFYRGFRWMYLKEYEEFKKNPNLYNTYV